MSPNDNSDRRSGRGWKDNDTTGDGGVDVGGVKMRTGDAGWTTGAGAAFAKGTLPGFNAATP